MGSNGSNSTYIYTGRSIQEHGPNIDKLRDFRQGGIIKIQAQNKIIFVNASIYKEAKVLMNAKPILPTAVLSNGLLVTQNDLIQITIGWENLINPEGLKKFFYGFPDLEKRKMFDVIQDMEDCDTDLDDCNTDFDNCKLRLIALGCPGSILDICIDALILLKPADYKIKRDAANNLVENLTIIGN